jgi:hypothetical protein
MLSSCRSGAIRLRLTRPGSGGRETAAPSSAARLASPYGARRASPYVSVVTSRSICLSVAVGARRSPPVASRIVARPAGRLRASTLPTCGRRMGARAEDGAALVPAK